MGRSRRPAGPRSSRSVPFLLPALALYGVFVLTDRPRAPGTASTTGTGSSRSTTSSVSTTSAGRSRSDLPRRPPAQRRHHRAVRHDPDPDRARPRRPAQPEAAGRRPGRCSSLYVLSEVATGALVWRQILRPDGLLDQGLGRGGRRRPVQEWLANPQVVLYSLFFVISWKYFGFHMVIMLAVPADPEGAGRSGSHRRRLGLEDVPLHHPALARTNHPRLAVPVDHRCAPAVRPGLGDDQGRADQRLVDDGDVPLRQLRKDLRYASAVSVVIFALSLIVALLYLRLVMRRDRQGPVRWLAPRAQQRHRTAHAPADQPRLALSVAVAVLGLVVVPISPGGARRLPDELLGFNDPAGLRPIHGWRATTRRS